MYKRIIFTTFCCLILWQPGKTQLIFNQYSTLLLDTAGYGSSGMCLPLVDVFLGLDPGFDTVATGMKTVVVITAVTGSVTVGGVAPAVGDTVRFDTSNAIPVSFSGFGWLSYEWWAVGTPSLLNEPYHCHGFAQSTVAGCMNHASVIPSSPDKDCTVSLANGIEETMASVWSIGPNPATRQIEVLNESSLLFEQACLIDLKGQKVRIWEESNLLNVGDLPRGLYLLEIRAKEFVERHKVLLLN